MRCVMAETVIHCAGFFVSHERCIGMKTNRFLSLAVSAAVLVALSACSSNEPRPAEPAPEQAAAPVIIIRGSLGGSDDSSG